MNKHSIPSQALPQEITIDMLLKRLEGVHLHGSHHWMAFCPAHDDSSPSLGIKQGRDGTILLRCFAGCAIEDIFGALSITIRELFPPTRSLYQQSVETFEDRAYIALYKQHRAIGKALSPHEKRRYLTAVERVLKAQKIHNV